MIHTNHDLFEAASRRSTVYSTKGIVSCNQPLASQAGIQVLNAGGNAADAAVAMVAALNVTEPVNCGLGGDLFALFWDTKQRRVRAVNGSGPSPAALTIDALRAAGISGQGIPYASVHSVTVPGAPAAMVDIVNTFGSGKVSLSDVFAPAVKLAEEGFAVHQIASYEWRSHEKLLVQQSKGDPRYPMLINGKAPVPGQFFTNPALGATYRRLGAEGKDGYYRGPVAQAIVDAIRSRGGLMTLEDLAAHATDFVEPISYTYGAETGANGDSEGWKVHECPPNGQGLAALIALGILDVLREDGILDLDSLDPSSPEWYHALIEAVRLAFADVSTYVADPNFIDIPVDRLLSKDYLRARAKLFDPNRAVAQHTAGNPMPSSDTVYLTAADSDGNAISLICSNYLGFGTAVVPKDTGFTLQCRGAAFSLDPKSPNALEGGKRPYHTIIPAMVTRGDELVLSFGVMGGVMQPQGHVQVLTNLVHKARGPQLALDAKRFCVGGTVAWNPDGSNNTPFYNGAVAVEEGIPEETLVRLEKMGHTLDRVVGSERIVFGKGQAILRTVDPISNRVVWAAGSDYRGDGVTVPQI